MNCIARRQARRTRGRSHSRPSCAATPSGGPTAAWWRRFRHHTQRCQDYAHVRRSGRRRHQQLVWGLAARPRGQREREREHGDVGLMPLRLAFLGRGDARYARMLRQQLVPPTPSAAAAPARRTERRQPPADQAQQLDPAQRERYQHSGGHRRRHDRGVAPLRLRHPRRRHPRNIEPTSTGQMATNRVASAVAEGRNIGGGCWVRSPDRPAEASLHPPPCAWPSFRPLQRLLLRLLALGAFALGTVVLRIQRPGHEFNLSRGCRRPTILSGTQSSPAWRRGPGA